MLNAKLDLLKMPVDEHPKVKIEMHGTCLLGVKSAVMRDIREMTNLEHVRAFRFILLETSTRRPKVETTPLPSWM